MNDVAKAAVNTDIPIGTVIASVLPPDVFLPTQTGEGREQWVLADGNPLPPNTRYEHLTGENNAPDLRDLDRALTVLDVTSASLAHGANVQQITDASTGGNNAGWTWISATRETKGYPGGEPHQDWEQDTNHFQSYIDSAGVVWEQSRTLNRKHNRWQEWRPGEANVLGIATRKFAMHHYIRVN